MESNGVTKIYEELRRYLFWQVVGSAVPFVTEIFKKYQKISSVQTNST